MDIYGFHIRLVQAREIPQTADDIADAFRPYGEVEKLSQPAETDRRVIRGGAFNSFDPTFADPALRFPQTEDTHSHGIGFRCAAEPRRT